MFEELIAHGNDMIRRLEKFVGLSYEELEIRPAHQQVAVLEAQAWRKAIEERIRSTFGQDTLTRYNIIGELYSDELKRGKGDEITRSLNAMRRIVALLEELEERLHAT